MTRRSPRLGLIQGLSPRPCDARLTGGAAGLDAHPENSSRTSSGRANGVFEPVLGMRRRTNASNDPCEKLFWRRAAEATNLLQGGEGNFLAMDVCNNTWLGHQRTSVFHIDFTGAVPIENGAQRNKIGVAATFIDPYDYLDVPAASFPKAFPVVGAWIIEDITNLCGHQRDFRMLNLFGHYHFLTVCKPPARLTFNTFLCGRIEVGRDRGQGRPLQGDCARSRGLALRQHERVTLK
jgi:hypothetical protein